MIPVLALVALSPAAQSDPPDLDRSAAAQANEARWADLDAQARMTDGDYDAAIQAEQHANAARRQAEELASQTPTRSPADETVPAPQRAP